MRIEFERSGGLMGRTVACSVDTETLPADEAHELRELVERADFFALPESPPGSAARSDQFAYTVRIESEGRGHTVMTSDDAAPSALVPLLDRLSRMARRSRGE
jgi:hypothetical protein